MPEWPLSTRPRASTPVVLPRTIAAFSQWLRAPGFSYLEEKPQRSSAGPTKSRANSSGAEQGALVGKIISSPRRCGGAARRRFIRSSRDVHSYISEKKKRKTCLTCAIHRLSAWIDSPIAIPEHRRFSSSRFSLLLARATLPRAIAAKSVFLRTKMHKKFGK
jgi:hypothetical protein